MFPVQYFTLDNGREIAYFPETQRYFFINEETKEFIADLRQEGKERAAGKHHMSPEEVDGYLKNMSNPTPPVSPENRELLFTRFSTQEELPRLVIHLSNDCNLRCIYCYANGGNYHSTRDLMTKEMLDRTLEVFLKRFRKINTIQFFGGEPLMNMPLLEYACEKISRINEAIEAKKEQEKKEAKEEPEAKEGAEEKDDRIAMGIVINGTLINERFCEIVNRYGLEVTVSYDGVPEVNDRLRVFPNGAGTSAIIEEKIRFLKEKTGQPGAIEATYTRFHEEAGVSVMDLFDYIHERFPDAVVQIAAAAGDKGCAYIPDETTAFPAGIAEVTRRILANNGEMVPCYLAAVNEFTGNKEKDKKLNPLFCAAGLNTLAVTTKGDIYPCFMLADIEELHMGNVCDENVLRGEQFLRTQRHLFFSCFKEDHEECMKCFAKETCTPCLGLMHLGTGELFKPAPQMCEEFRRSKAEAIKGMAMIQDFQKQKAAKEEKESAAEA